jgi:hypothetical protein
VPYYNNSKSRTIALKHSKTSWEFKKALKPVETNIPNERTVLRSIKEAFARGINLRAKLHNVNETEKNGKMNSESGNKFSGTLHSRNKKGNNFNSTTTLGGSLGNRQKPNGKEKVVKNSNSVQRIPTTRPKLSMTQLKERTALNSNHMSAKNILTNTDYFTMKSKKAVVQANTSVTNAIHVLNKITKTYSSR